MTHRLVLKVVSLLAVWLSSFALAAQSQPVGLRCDLVEHTDRVFVQGELTQLSLEEIDAVVEPVQVPLIRSAQPTFSWAMEDARPATLQTAFRVQVGASSKLADGDLVWDSAERSGSQPAVRITEAELRPATTYHWRVKLWNNHGEQTAWSPAKGFRTAAELTPGGLASYPLQQRDEFVQREREIEPGLRLYDFGKAAFGRVKLTATARAAGQTLTVRFGEVITRHDRLDRAPGGSRRFREVELPLVRGTHTYTVVIKKDGRNTGPKAIAMPDYVGDVYPFRYCEIEGGAELVQVSRETVTHPFDDHSADFACADPVLNDIWDFCKYSIKATNFTGLYVDGDRERIPYEADAYINQLCGYGVDDEYTVARRTQEYLLFNATWPTEWLLSTVLMAWEDYLYTGNPGFIARFYEELQHKALVDLTEGNGLISTTTGKLTDAVRDAVHFQGRRIRDIVDWPHKGILGLSGDNSGETDGFVFTDYNAVVNAYHNRALRIMAQIAGAVGKPAGAAFYEQRAEAHREAFNELFFDAGQGRYTDGIDTAHSSLHANMFALAFGLVPQERVESVTAFVRSRGMACSVYGSQHLLDAVYAGEEAAYGLALLTAEGDRGWAHAIYDVGTTISLEAWDNRYKPNQDWNHAWGAAPANLIPMRLMGVKPTTPGFATFRVKPQPADLAWGRLRHPSIRGAIVVGFEQEPGRSFDLTVEVPANTEAEVWVPCAWEEPKLTVNGQPVEARRLRDFLVVEGVGSGRWVFAAR